LRVFGVMVRVFGVMVRVWLAPEAAALLDRLRASPKSAILIV